MTSDTERIQLLCAKLQSLGYAPNSTVRIYGEEFQVLSSPFPEGNGVAVEAKSTRKHAESVRKLRIPLPIIQVAMPPKHRPAA